MRNFSKKALKEAAEYLAPLSEEQITQLFPDWKEVQAAHIGIGMTVEESYEDFCKDWLWRGKPRLVEGVV
jgi:hypothetical protein